MQNLMVGAALGTLLLARATLPPVDQLPANADLPDPLITLNGEKVISSRLWIERRRPELKELFQHYMYGELPPAPDDLRATVAREDRDFLDGRATLKHVVIRFGPPDTPEINLLLVVPNRRTGPAPVFVGLNFWGNHALADDPQIPLPTAWVPPQYAGNKEGIATGAGRGLHKDVWALDQSIGRGYAVATCYCGDIDPDKNDFTDGVHPHFSRDGSKERGPHDWGTIAAWAWGLSRMVDYLVTDPDLDKSRIAVVGHSRLGKTALLAGALDERIALVVANQAGCGGPAPSRKTGDSKNTAESVEKINNRFPHWFCDEFKKFNTQVERLPFDQHCLIALCAPRPVLLCNAEEDLWADPAGQFRALQAAEPVYKLLGAGGLDATSLPAANQPVLSTLGYYLRPGKHSMTRGDWRVYLDFADSHFADGR